MRTRAEVETTLEEVPACAACGRMPAAEGIYSCARCYERAADNLDSILDSLTRCAATARYGTDRNGRPYAGKPIPGGDALTELAPYAEPGTVEQALDAGADPDFLTGPETAAEMLAVWTRALGCDVVTSLDTLARTNPGPLRGLFADLAAHARRLETITGAGEASRRTGRTCPTCTGAELVLVHGPTNDYDRYECPARDCDASYRADELVDAAIERARLSATTYDAWVDIATAAKVLKRPSTTIRRWIDTGTVKHRRGVGGLAEVAWRDVLAQDAVTPRRKRGAA